MIPKFLKKPLPYLALILAHTIWGGTFVVAKVTLEEFPSNSLAFLRFALASLLLAPFFLAETKKIKIISKDLPTLVGIGVFMISINIVFFFEGLQRTTALSASILTLIIPILSVILGWIFLKEKIYIYNLLGIVLGFLGALMVLGVSDIATGNFSYQSLLGNLLIILSSLSFVIGAILCKQMLEKYPSLTITAIAFMVGTIIFFIPAALEYLNEPTWISKVTLIGVLGLLYMAILSSISSYFLFEWGLSRLGVIKADMFQFIEPIVTFTLAVSFLEERITPIFLTGGILVVIGVYLGTISKEIHHRKNKAHRI